jgi:hypothetical protein
MSSLHSILCLTKIRTMKFIPTVLSYEPNWWVGECRPVNTSTPEYWLCYHLIRTLLSGANTASVFACRTRVIRAQRPPVLGSCTPAVRDKTSTYFRELHASCLRTTSTYFRELHESCLRTTSTYFRELHASCLWTTSTYFRELHASCFRTTSTYFRELHASCFRTTSTYFRELHASCSPRTYAHVQGSCMRAVCEIQCVRALTRPSSFHRSDSVTLKQWPVPLNPWHDFTQSLQTCRNS